MKQNEFNQYRFTRKSVLNIIIHVLLLYFIFHSLYGSRGILAYFKIQAEIEHSYANLELLRSERLEIENRVKLLRPGSLDKDMLDEQARNVLGVARSSEKVFRVKKKNTKD